MLTVGKVLASRIGSVKIALDYERESTANHAIALRMTKGAW